MHQILATINVNKNTSLINNYNNNIIYFYTKMITFIIFNVLFYVHLYSSFRFYDY